MPFYLRTVRIRADLTQAELGKASGISQVQISKLESGQVRAPSFETVVRLAKVLRVPPEMLRFGAPPRRKGEAA